MMKFAMVSEEFGFIAVKRVYSAVTKEIYRTEKGALELLSDGASTLIRTGDLYHVKVFTP